MSTLRNAYYSQYDQYDEYEDEAAYSTAARKKGLPKRKAAIAGRVFNTLKRNPMQAFGGLLFTGLATVIAVNALVLQTSRHPAPIFASTPASVAPAQQEPQPTASAERVAPVAAPVQTSAIPQPVARQENTEVTNASQSGDAIGDIIRTGSTSAPPAIPVPRATAVPQPPQRQDSIADLIRSNGLPPARPGERVSSTAPVDDSQKRVVMGGQQALNKLGYGPLTADGVLGNGTKKAIERFEFDRRLPVTGTLNRQTLAELASTSRMTIR